MAQSLFCYVNDRQLKITKLQKVLIPQHKTKQMRFEAPVYSVKFYNETIITSTKGQEILILDKEFNVLNRIEVKYARWTITDFHINNGNIAFSSLCPIIHFQNMETMKLQLIDLGDELCVWSVKVFGNKIFAGCTEGLIILHDIERKKNLLVFEGHDDDVNSVAFVDEHVMLSGSDDSYIKVWDTRSMGACGTLVGHTEGITHLDTKDERFVISNGKDQCLKLWDLRMMKTNYKPTALPPTPNWDYRWMEYPLLESHHPDDCSIRTFRGHKIQRTLIRCYFSQQNDFIYTGSADGVVHIFGINDDFVLKKRTGGLVRDLDWHPHDPLLLAAPWSINGQCGYIQCYEPKI